MQFFDYNLDKYFKLKRIFQLKILQNLKYENLKLIRKKVFEWMKNMIENSKRKYF
jgi:hypothetical protein